MCNYFAQLFISSKKFCSLSKTCFLFTDTKSKINLHINSLNSNTCLFNVSIQNNITMMGSYKQVSLQDNETSICCGLSRNYNGGKVGCLHFLTKALFLVLAKLKVGCLIFASFYTLKIIKNHLLLCYILQRSVRKSNLSFNGCKVLLLITYFYIYLTKFQV